MREPGPGLRKEDDFVLTAVAASRLPPEKKAAVFFDSDTERLSVLCRLCDVEFARVRGGGAKCVSCGLGLSSEQVRDFVAGTAAGVADAIDPSLRRTFLARLRLAWRIVRALWRR